MRDSTQISFDRDIKDGMVLVDFWAPWCPPCRALSPILDEIDKELVDIVSVLKVNADNEPEILSTYGILGLPTLLLFHQGVVVDKLVGAQSKSGILSFIEKHRQLQ